MKALLIAFICLCLPLYGAADVQFNRSQDLPNTVLYVGNSSRLEFRCKVCRRNRTDVAYEVAFRYRTANSTILRNTKKDNSVYDSEKFKFVFNDEYLLDGSECKAVTIQLKAGKVPNGTTFTCIDRRGYNETDEEVESFTILKKEEEEPVPTVTTEPTDTLHNINISSTNCECTCTHGGETTTAAPTQSKNSSGPINFKFTNCTCICRKGKKPSSGIGIHSAVSFGQLLLTVLITGWVSSFLS